MGASSIKKELCSSPSFLLGIPLPYLQPQEGTREPGGNLGNKTGREAVTRGKRERAGSWERAKLPWGNEVLESARLCLLAPRVLLDTYLN